MKIFVMLIILLSCILVPSLITAQQPAGVDTLKKPMIVMKNVKFRYTEDIYIMIDELVGSVVPKAPNTMVNFDDINSFKMDIAYGTIFINTEVMDAIYNTRVLNYEGSRLRNMKTTVVETGKGAAREKKLRVSGQSKIGLVWMSFEMTGSPMLWKEKNAIYIKTESMKVIGISVKGLMDAFSLNMGKFISIREGRGITMDGNNLILDPYVSMGPPDSYGILTGLELKDNGLKIRIGKKLPLYGWLMPVSGAVNYIFICQGSLQFARTLTMRNGKMELIDNNTADYFDFYMKKYLVALPLGNVKQTADGSVIATIPDYSRAAGMTNVAERERGGR
jgi:hypothetical protein